MCVADALVFALGAVVTWNTVFHAVFSRVVLRVSFSAVPVWPRWTPLFRVL